MPRPPTARTGGPRPSLRSTVLNIAVAAIVSAALVWSALFVDLARKRSEAAARPASAPAAQADTPTAQAPAPVTTRTS